jgi:hypothetical protein
LQHSGYRGCLLVAKRAVLLATAVLAFLPASALASHNDEVNSAQVLNSPGSALGAVGPFAHDNIGATYDGTEPVFCTRDDGVQVSYARSVWYEVYPHRNGRLAVVVDTQNFFAVVAVLPFDLSTGVYEDGPCDVATAFGRAAVETDVSSQKGYLIQIGAYYTDPNNVPQGSFTLSLTFDPDTDADGLRDSQDECPGQGGSAAHRGCPDSDGDGLRDRDDGCPAQRGPAGLGGCPDSDGDSIVDKSDACPGENSSARDANRNGCLDHATLNVKVKLTYRDWRRGIRVKSFRVRGLVRGATIDVRCKRPKCRRFRGKSRVESLTIRRFRGAPLRAGTRVIVRITLPGYIGTYFDVRIKKGGYRARESCLQPGSNRPQRRCNPVR